MSWEQNIPDGPAGEAKTAYDARLKRVNDAIDLKEPDRVPCIPFYSTFPYRWAGYSMADVMYDVSKAQDAIRKYVTHFEPDMTMGYSSVCVGQGRFLDKLDPTWLEWAGRKTGKLGDDSMCQFIEFPILEDEETEYPAFNSDMSGWIINKYLPKAFNSMKALENLSFKNCLGWGSLSFAMQFLNPEVMKAFQTLSEAGQLAAKFYGEVAAFNAELEALGFPLVMKATTVAAFDTFSNNLRGTILSLQDIIAEPDEMKKAIEQFYPGSLYGALAQAKYSNGRFVYIPMHKGMDGFMSDAQYREFYWDTLKRLIMALIDMGHTPWIYTEGKYDSRLKYLTELPRGKVWIHFEDVDMKEAKRLVGANACISGGIQAELLRTATTDKVRDEVKRNMDICAPGGGYIFDFGESMDDCKPENVETLFDTVKTYGKYR